MYTKLHDEKRANLLRTNSICPTPETVLLDLVLRNETENIQKLVQNNTKLLNHIYTDYNKPILLIACSEPGVEPETVKTLIDLGANLTYENVEEWQAIHFAAHATNSKVLKVVIEGMKSRGLDINAVQQGNNALHVLIKFGNSESEKEHNDCAKILLEEGIDVNLGDGKGFSPILWAAKKSLKSIIKTILEKSPIAVDLDSHKQRGKSARDILTSENLYEGQLPEKIIDTTDNTLLELIKKRNENAFINYKNGDIFEIVNEHDTSQTLLQCACKNGLNKVVKHLLDKGADPNLKIKKSTSLPIQIAAEHGFHKIFKLLLDHGKIELPHSILITLLKSHDQQAYPSAGIDWAKCYRDLMDKIKDSKDIDINELDQSRNSALHYAMRYCEPEISEELLDLGASLGAKNKFGLMPVQDMEPEMLEKHLDKCVQFDIKGRKDKEDFCVTFNYRTLIPPARKVENRKDQDTSDPESRLGSERSRGLVRETEVIYYMSEAPEFKHLLTHPVIVSFLFMKWHRIRWLFWINLAFYIAFFISLVAFIFSSYANFNTKQTSLEHVLGIIAYVALWVTFLVLLLRELFQVAVSPTKYFKNFENYIELVLIFITGCILFISSPSENTRKQLSAISILLAAFELVLMFGQHPKLSANVVMLRTVSYNFFKFLIWYSLLIIAFALSFYILFTETQNKPVNGTNEEEEEDFFTDPGKSMFKTIVMLTGEFDASDMNFHTFPIISKLIFVLFIFMIAIILLNLLNGLAVSDTQIIKKNAKLLGHIYRAQHIMYVETMLQGNILPKNVLNKIEDLFCCCPFDKEWNYTLLQPLAKKACLFPDILNYELTIYPNRNGQIALSAQVVRNKFIGCCCLFGCCSNIYLGKNTVRRTKCIVQARREQAKSSQELSQMQRIESFIEEWKRSAQSEMLMLNSKVEHIMRQLNQESTG